MKIPLPRPELAVAAPAVHGALDYMELGRLRLSADEILDFSVNSNPFGPSPTVGAALQTVPLDRYPDRDALALRAALAEHHHVGMESIIVGNGTSELIQLIALAYLRPGDHVMVIGPTFGEYARACQIMGAQVHRWDAHPDDAFALDTDAVTYILPAVQPRLFFICRPNNPTGGVIPLSAVSAWAESSPETLFVVDEAYIAFAEGLESCLTLGKPNILVLRSMTKDYALAGLRLGYAVGPLQSIDPLLRVRPAWNVNALAQAAGLAALRDQKHVQQTLTALRAAARDLRHGLRGLGFNPLPSAVHFFLMKVGNATDWRARLLRRRILVRDCSSFGLPAYIRIATRTPEQNAMMIAALREEQP